MKNDLKIPPCLPFAKVMGVPLNFEFPPLKKKVKGDFQLNQLNNDVPLTNMSNDFFSIVGYNFN